MSGVVVHTLVPGANIPAGYFSPDNIEFLQNKITRVLSEFKQNIRIDVASIKRVMARILEERIESVPKMNQRVIMSIASEFRRHEDTVQRALNWEETYRHDASQLVDRSAGSARFDFGNYKQPRGGGFRPVDADMSTVRFYFV